MAKDVADVLGTAIGRVAREAAKNVQISPSKRSRGGLMEKVNDAVSDRMNGALSGPKGVAAGVGVATLAPLVAKGAGKLVRGAGNKVGDKAGGVGDKVGGKVKDAVSDKVDEAGGPAGIAKEAGKSMLPGGGNKKKESVPGVGKGRRMPFQWDIDIGVPLETVYDHWTNFEEWPKFMHRLQSVSQEDDEHVKFKAKIWGISREFTAEVVEHTPQQRIKWKVTEGLTHQGVVTFHELAPRLTRVEVSFDVEPGGMIEKMARGMRHVKRAARADLSRFKAYVLMEEDTSEDESEPSRGERKESSSRSSSSPSRSATKRSSSSSRGRSSSGRKRSSSSGRKSTSSSGRKSSPTSSVRKSSSSSGRKSSSSGRTRASSGGQKRSASKRSSSSSNGRSSANRTRASSSSNGRSTANRTRSSSSSNGSSGSGAKKRSGARS